MAPIVLLIILITMFTCTYVMNKRTGAPVVIQKKSSCHSCSNHTCSQYKGGEE